jgi:hypothetical protein
MKIIYEMKDAKIEDGGSGAFYIFLKKNKIYKINFERSVSLTQII